MTVLGNAHVVTMDDAGTELDSGWIRIEDGFVAEVGSGEPPEPGDDLAGAVVTPALINTHHHLFQTLTRARAQEARSEEHTSELQSQSNLVCRLLLAKKKA